MFKYRIIGQLGLTLPEGTPVRLGDAQLTARKHLVAPVEGQTGFVAAGRDRLQFKHGETIELLTALPAGQVANGIVEQIDVAGAVVAKPGPSKPTPAPGQKAKADKVGAKK